MRVLFGHTYISKVDTSTWLLFLLYYSQMCCWPFNPFPWWEYLGSWKDLACWWATMKPAKIAPQSLATQTKRSARRYTWISKGSKRHLECSMVLQPWVPCPTCGGRHQTCAQWIQGKSSAIQQRRGKRWFHTCSIAKERTKIAFQSVEMLLNKSNTWWWCS